MFVCLPFSASTAPGINPSAFGSSGTLLKNLSSICLKSSWFPLKFLFPHYIFLDEHPPRFGNGINAAIHRALATASFDGEDSKLKVLTLEGYEPSDSEALVEARKKLTVNIVTSVVFLD